MNFVSIDFETANEKRFSPCAVGVVVANEQEILDEYYSLINPLTEFRSFNTYIHGITEADVTDAPTFPEVWVPLKGYLDRQLVVAHNASFDMSVLRQTLDRFDLIYPEMDYLCTANIAKKVWPGLENHKLNTLASHHEIRFEHHHALEDARVAAKVFMKLLAEHEHSSMEALLKSCRMTKGTIYERGYTAPKSRQAKKKSRRIYF